MTKSRIGTALITVLFAGLLFVGCSNKKTNPISAFQPEIINTADAFQLQVTDASHVSTTLIYTWVNTNTQATINHSTVTTGGSATVFLIDAADATVYGSELATSLNEPSTVGTPGNWTVRVVFQDFSGTANFRVEKL